jgi:hypothetical protein
MKFEKEDILGIWNHGDYLEKLDQHFIEVVLEISDTDSYAQTSCKDVIAALAKQNDEFYVKACYLIEHQAEAERRPPEDKLIYEVNRALLVMSRIATDKEYSQQRGMMWIFNDSLTKLTDERGLIVAMLKTPEGLQLCLDRIKGLAVLTSGLVGVVKPAEAIQF